jgi:predicted metal-dependent hydrolase
MIHVLLFGTWYAVEKATLTTSTLGLGVHLKDQTITVVTSHPTSATIPTQLNVFIQGLAERYLIPRIERWANTMGVSYGRITLREQRSRWGSCSSLGNLNFNWRLAHHHPSLIDYVIIHELAHRVHLDHSRAFWQLVAKYDPEYRSHTGKLKRISSPTWWYKTT